MKFIQSTIALLIILAANSTEARPVGFKYSTSVMSENKPDENHFMLHYTPNRFLSVGPHYLRIARQNNDVYALYGQANLLIHRWNQDHLQANIYATGGVGHLNFQDKSRLSEIGGAQFDIEDRQFYALAKYSGVFADDFKTSHNARGRLGFAPYIANYDELNSWLMLQYDFSPNEPTKHSLSPFVRVFYKSLLVEFGSSLKGDWLLNFVSEF